ncbi:bifunctional nuclease family protein [bacterium]|nr:bifunctional nuclease family protein [bacterium]
MIVPVRVDRVTLEPAKSQFIVILRDDVNNRWLPMLVGQSEAQAIALKLEKITPPRPMTHDLLHNLLHTIDAEIDKITICDLREGTYYATINLQINNETVEIDSRPSDAIAIALRMKAPIFIDEKVMREAAVWDQYLEEEDFVQKNEKEAYHDQLETLNIELQKAVQDERYEDAAHLRDEINELKSAHQTTGT